MTPESVRLGLGTTSTETAVAVGIASGSFLAADSNRVAVILGSHNVNLYSVSSLNPAVLGQGVSVPVGVGEIVMTLDTHGTFVQKALFAIGAAAITVGVVAVTTTVKG